jgi:SAM-dependent methyltransferase
MSHAIPIPSAKLTAFADEFPWERRTILAYMCEVASELEPGTRVLDVGAGEQPYRELFEHVDYVTSDWAHSVHPGARRVDIVAPADDLPVPEGSFDAVICTQVLEHVAEPGDVLAELFRVLRLGGRLFITVPLTWEEHEAPYDFFRYTRFGLAHLMAGAGFRDIAVSPRNDVYSTIAQLLRNTAAITHGGSHAEQRAQRAVATQTLHRLADLVADYAPLDAQWILPLGYHARAARQTPVDRPACRRLLGMEDARPAAYLAYADELIADEALLRAFAARVDGDDPITLIVYASKGDSAELTDELTAAVERAGLAGDGTADVFAVALGSAVDEAALARAVDGVLSARRLVHGPLGRVPRFGADMLDGLRAHARAAAERQTGTAI